MDNKEYWKEELEGVIECFNDEYAEEIGINKLTEEDKDELAYIVLGDDNLWSIIDNALQEIIEEYCNRKFGGE